MRDGIIGIYKITNNIDGHCYIGQSINIERRFEEHVNSNNTNKYLRDEMNKYGVNNFTFDIVETCDKDKLSDREKYWIQYFNSTYPNGYNLTDGGNGGNTFQYRTEEEMELTRKRISEVTSGENNGFYGKHHSDSTIEFLRKINIGKKMSEETKEKLSKSLKGHYMPKEAKNKISEATKKQWQNEDFKKLMKKISTGNKYAQNNTWNIGRTDVFHPSTYEHKRVFSYELDEYINNGYIKGIPPNDKRYTCKIKHCSIDNLVGVYFNSKTNKWISYINFKNKRYGTKSFADKQNAIQHRNNLEMIFTTILENNIDIDNIDIKESIKQNKVVLYCD